MQTGKRSVSVRGCGGRIRGAQIFTTAQFYALLSFPTAGIKYLVPTTKEEEM